VYPPPFHRRAIQQSQLATNSDDTESTGKREEKGADATTHNKKELRK